MKPALALALSLALAPGLTASSWLFGESTTAWKKAVQLVAEARFQDAQAFLEGVEPQEAGRWSWLHRLLEDQARAEKHHPDVVFWAFSYHNLYLFLKAEGVEGKFLEDAFLRAQKVYEAAQARLWERTRVPEVSADTEIRRLSRPLRGSFESLRIAYAGLLFDSGRSQEAQLVLEKTKRLGLGYELGKGPLTAGSLEGMSFHYRMLGAYCYAAQGRSEEAVTLLIGAADLRPHQTLEWLLESDDFVRLKEDPGFQKLLKGLQEGL